MSEADENWKAFLRLEIKQFISVHGPKEFLDLIEDEALEDLVNYLEDATR